MGARGAEGLAVEVNGGGAVLGAHQAPTEGIGAQPVRPIEPGRQTVTANVWIRFALGPESGD